LAEAHERPLGQACKLGDKWYGWDGNGHCADSWATAEWALVAVNASSKSETPQSDHFSSLQNH